MHCLVKALLFCIIKLKSIATDKELFQPKSIDILLSFLQKKKKNVHRLIHGCARADCVRMCQLSEYSETRILHVVSSISLCVSL